MFKYFQRFVRNLDASEVPLDSYEHLSPCDGSTSGCYWTIATATRTSLGGWLRGKSELETGLPLAHEGCSYR